MKSKLAWSLAMVFICCISMMKAQHPLGTLADSLRGSSRPERTCYDVTTYDLHVRVDTLNRSISGSNRIGFTAVTNFNRLQIDLFSNKDISRIMMLGKELIFKRNFNAVFVEMPREIIAGEKASITVYYSGKPITAKNPPWDGGFSWSKDEKGKLWIGVSCQGVGASLWWPCKEDASDEPESMNIHCNVPTGLICVANGKEEPSGVAQDGTTTFNWSISYPINNYNVSINIGDYVHWHDTYTAADGDTLALDYYVIRNNLEKSREQFKQVKPMLACYEKYLGKYPFWNDGYALIETPYLGMEHQSGIAYGNRYKQQYLGMDRSGQKLPFDYIIIHESGHEWWGNSVSCKDIADMWIHESFCTYSEAIYVECMHGYDTAMKYVNALKSTVSNTSPIIGTYGINREGHSDMYVKGMLFLNTLRHVVNDDDKWWSMIKTMCDTTFRYKVVDYGDVVNYFNNKTGLNLDPVFDQYVKHASLPIFTYKLKKKGKHYLLKYRWQAEVTAFNMPMDVEVKGKKIRLFPGYKWKKIKLDMQRADEFRMDENVCYVRRKQF
jgi:aminopeptidase N